MSHAFAVLAYRNSPFLEACVQSVTKQKRPSDQIVITTSTPSDYIEAIAARYKIPILVNPVRRSIAVDWSFAYNSVDTEWVTLAHQDDSYREDYLATLSELLNSNPDAILAQSSFYEHDGDGRPHRHLNWYVKLALRELSFLGSNVIRGRSAKRRMLLLGNPVGCPTVMYNRRLIGPYRFDDSLRSNLDWQAWLDFADRKGAFVYSRLELVRRNVHSEMATAGLVKDFARMQEDRRIFEQLWGAAAARAIMGIYRLSYREAPSR